MTPLEELAAFAAVVQSKGFRGAARAHGTSPSRLSETIRRLEDRLGVRLLHRTTRSVVPTEIGARLYERLSPSLQDIGRALEAVHETKDRPAGRLRLNVPVSVVRLVLPHIVPAFLKAYPEIELEVVADDRFVNVLTEGFDAGIRYGERLEQDMVAIPIGPRVQRFALGASATYLAQFGNPRHPRDLLKHSCFRGRFGDGVPLAWEFARGGKAIKVDVKGPLLVGLGNAADLAVDAALEGAGIVYLFEEWLQPHFDRGSLKPVLADWWPGFSGPFLYFAGRSLLPGPLRAFVDHVKSVSAAKG
jgi:DNA-binding transcriptional LysR family regulator